MTETERLRSALRLAIDVAERLAGESEAGRDYAQVDIGGAQVPWQEAIAIARHELRCSGGRVT